MRFVIKLILYFCALYVFVAVSWLPQASAVTVLLAAVVLALVNTLIRPIISVIALPLSLITFGIAIIFINVLTLVIASGITGGALASPFWVKLVIAVVIMAIDNGIRFTRHESKKRLCA